MQFINLFSCLLNKKKSFNNLEGKKNKNKTTTTTMYGGKMETGR